MFGYLDRMLRRRDLVARTPNSADERAAVRPFGGPFFIPPSLYDAAVSEGFDMRPFVKQQPIPKAVR